MAFGCHWEWRGFGIMPDATRKRISRLPLWFQTPSPILDIYLWTPAMSTNVKLRGDALKFKRFIAREGPFECWLEDETELIPFPLGGEVLAVLAEALGLTLPPPDRLLTRPAALLHYLQQEAPVLQVVPVRKQRRLHHYHAPSPPPVIVELSEVLGPESVASLALEHPQLGLLQAAHAALAADVPNLQPLSYMEAVSCWAQGRRL